MEVQPSDEKIQILCRRDGNETEGFARLHPFQHSERVSRAFKIASAFFGVGLLTVFIPILHFVLPPLFFLAGIAFAVATYHTKAEIISGEFTCPSCRALNQLTRQSESFPTSPRCSSCHLTLELDRKALER